MQKPNKVTFTGVDNQTDLNRLASISKKYPSVEWGVLFSKRNQGNSRRYPSIPFIEALTAVYIDVNPPINFSAHICGRYSNDIMENNIHDPDLVNLLRGNFQRTQINIADGETSVTGDLKVENAETFARIIGAKSAIVQCRGNFPKDNRVDWLYDTSGGAGMSPSTWDAKEDETEAYCGYAGGIGPDNVLHVLDRINASRTINRNYWIDMEGNVRTDEWLDLDKCESVLKQVYGD